MSMFFLRKQEISVHQSKKNSPGSPTRVKDLYYDPEKGFSGVQDIARKAELPISEVRSALHKEDTYTLHKPVTRNFLRRRVWVPDIDSQWQADLVDMQKYKTHNKNFNYILTVIDVFSKYAWAMAIKRKTGDEITKAFKAMFKERIPQIIQTDLGREFISKQTQQLFQDKNIHWFATGNETKAQICERFNRTLKTKMWKYFTANDTKKWTDVLSKLVYNYNYSYHRSIKMTLVEASKSKNEKTVWLKED